MSLRCLGHWDARQVSETVSKRQAAATLLKMARNTADPRVAARFIGAAADMKEQAGDLPPPLSPKAPDVQTGG